MADLKELWKSYPRIAFSSLMILFSSLLYIAEEGLVRGENIYFYVLLGILVFSVILKRLRGSEPSKDYLIRVNLFLWTSASFVTARLLVRAAEIGNPSSPVGDILGIPISQIWLAGYHIHHYFLGIFLMTVSTLLLLEKTRISRKKIAIVFGIGLGLLLDEIGFLLSMGDYSAPVTFPIAGFILLMLFLNTYIRSLEALLPDNWSR